MLLLIFILNFSLGPFRIDIQSIKLLQQLDSKYSSESEYKKPNFHRIGASSTSNQTRVPGKISLDSLFADSPTTDNNSTESIESLPEKSNLPPSSNS